jgi:hypothetical protein
VPPKPRDGGRRAASRAAPLRQKRSLLYYIRPPAAKKAKPPADWQEARDRWRRKREPSRTSMTARCADREPLRFGASRVLGQHAIPEPTPAQQPVKVPLVLDAGLPRPPRRSLSLRHGNRRYALIDRRHQAGRFALAVGPQLACRRRCSDTRLVRGRAGKPPLSSPGIGHRSASVRRTYSMPGTPE